MAYVRIGEDESTLGSFGCGPGCSCKSCRTGTTTLEEWYVPEEDERETEPSPTPANSPNLRMPAMTGSRVGFSFGEPQARRRVPAPPPPARVRPFVALDRFEFDRAVLMLFHLTMIHRVAQQVVASWQTSSPIRTIRLFGHTDPVGPESHNLNLGQQRALAVQARLIQEIERLKPGLSRQINIVVRSLGKTCPATSDPSASGRARNRRVDLFLSTFAPQQPGQAPAGPSPAQTRPVRIPTPEEVAKRIVPKQAIRDSARAAAMTPAGTHPGSPPLEAWDLGQPSPAGPVFSIECPAGCSPVVAGQCRNILLRAIRDAIHLASNAASKLEASPRNANTVSIFLKLFGHDPSRPVSWAENKESGSSVAWRLRRVAQELGGGRRTLYRCGCPGAAPTVNARTVSPLEVLLCPRFWSLGQPGFLPAGQDPRWIRAGTILHEMLHQLFGEFFRHFRVPPRPDDPQERRRDNAHCYEAFALLVDGHTPSQSDVNRCTKRPA
jgi:outer membrane protein OmpA-like peptidoglycan-associated protein